MLQICGGKHKKRKLITPKSTHIRPTTSKLRETVFNICQHQIKGANFLDLFAGSGAIGLEALSRGATHTTFVEKNHLSIISIKRNIAFLGEKEHTTLIRGNVLTVLPLLQDSFDLIYADPPYAKGIGTQILAAIDCLLILKKSGLLFIEDTNFKEPPLKNLKLKQKRQVGLTTLFEYVIRHTEEPLAKFQP